ncbi:B12-binding domain-containing radical SAM protein [Oryzomonas sagensis]|uniref:B12-binding domain-containing radical SAM protein n=1 Tax=Oryzomonas sagensis TaxID=2603857 RepID=A0ABQ6TN53_9BACT|nr:radical SAM protein [Oryzomonas sagensis]KAB0669808.1 B12-binding domain-containing radical SAM protein [Oryzomonas sagensis]
MTAAPRLLLIYPATQKLGWVRRFQLPSLSLKQVAAATPPEWEVLLADEIHEDIPFDGQFDLVGITAMTHQAVRAYEIADRFRQRGTPVVLGGIHPTVLPDEALQHADAVVIGEAEPVWAQLLSDLQAGRMAPRYRAIPHGDLLEIPWSRRDFLAGRTYLTTQTIQASRGCPYDCPFCTVTPYFGRTFRYRDPDDILAELRSFDRKLTVFLDDNILGDPERAKPILRGMAGLGLRWGGQANLRFAEDPELVSLLAQSGCIGIFVGIESVTGLQANHPKTGSRFSQADLIKRVRDTGIVLEASMIFGFDDHDESVFETTVRYLEECAPSIPTFHILTPYPGTALFEQFDREGRMLHKEWQHYDHNQVVFRPKLMSPEQLYRGWRAARREVYRWPSVLSRVMRGNGKLVNLAYNVLRRGGVYGDEEVVYPPKGSGGPLGHEQGIKP